MLEWITQPRSGKFRRFVHRRVPALDIFGNRGLATIEAYDQLHLSTPTTAGQYPALLPERSWPHAGANRLRAGLLNDRSHQRVGERQTAAHHAGRHAPGATTRYARRVPVPPALGRCSRESGIDSTSAGQNWRMRRNSQFPGSYPLRVHRHNGRHVASRFRRRPHGVCCGLPVLALVWVVKRVLSWRLPRL